MNDINFDEEKISKLKAFELFESRVLDNEIKILLKNALTDKINDCEIFMKGIDKSYDYEDFSKFNFSDLRIQNERSFL